MNVSTVLRLYLVFPFNSTPVRKLMVVVVCPGAMKVNISVISGDDIILS